MVDYARIAEEEKAKQDAAAFAETEKQKREEASLAFFKGIECSLADEMMKANPELLGHGLLTGHRTGGITMDAKRFDTQIRMSYGRAASCEVNFDQAHLMVLVELTIEQRADRPVPPQKLAFCLGTSNSRVVAGKVESDQEPRGRFEPEDIAEIVMAGIIRGHFE